MAALSIQSAASLDADTLAGVFNTGYSGYIVPVNLTTDQLQTHIWHNDIDLAASRVMLDGREPVGVCFLAYRGMDGWIGGLGVHPDYRRQGLGRQLMQAVIHEARSRGLESIYLEVIVGNAGAHQLYSDLSFVDTRRLLILERQPAPVEIGKIEVETVTAADVLDLQATMHLTPATWQQSANSLRHDAANTPAWCAVDSGIPRAYVIGHASNTTLHWLDVGCAPEQQAALQSLLAHLHQQYPDSTARIVNLGENEPAAATLLEMGYHETLSQHEMRLDL